MLITLAVFTGLLEMNPWTLIPIVGGSAFFCGCSTWLFKKKSFLKELIRVDQPFPHHPRSILSMTWLGSYLLQIVHLQNLHNERKPT